MTAPPARRILMTADAVGGVWTYATDLARGLCRLGSEVTLVVMGPAPTRQQLAALRGVPRLQMEITDLALEWMDPHGVDIDRSREKLLSIASRARPDAVHLNSYREASFAWPAPVLVVAHSCVWSWWEACRGALPNEVRWDHYAAAVRAGLMAADAWVAPTAAFRDSIAARYPTRAHGRVIHNGISLPAIACAKEPFVLAAGRIWDEAKNLAALASIAPQLVWPVRAAGPTMAPGTAAIESTFGAMQCLGVLSRSQMAAQMRHAGIFVSPALYEPFGLCALEAAACGCALVLSDIPGFRELWTGAAFFVPPRDVQALAAAVNTLCRGDRLRTRMQEAARRRSHHYRLSAMVKSYNDLYRDIRRIAPAGQTAPSSIAAAELAA
jgi:glycosyltransferase involved in cell wall biosynthesis